jgi:hypothetical protein
MQAVLDLFRDYIQKYDPLEDPYEIIFGWRNGTLHGERSWGAVGGTVLNLAILIGLERIAPDYARRREIALGRYKNWHSIREHDRSMGRTPDDSIPHWLFCRHLTDLDYPIQNDWSYSSRPS